jgi:hypothetical protein
MKEVSPKNLKTEEGVEELTDSPMMRPYVRLAEAIMTQQGLKEAVAETGRLPLEQHYLWRVLSALKWGFADFDSVNVVIDRKTLGPDDRKRIAELLQYRPAQFCLFLKALLGDEAMEQMDAASDRRRETGSLYKLSGRLPVLIGLHPHLPGR